MIVSFVINCFVLHQTVPILASQLAVQWKVEFPVPRHRWPRGGVCSVYLTLMLVGGGGAGAGAILGRIITMTLQWPRPGHVPSLALGDNMIRPHQMSPSGRVICPEEATCGASGPSVSGAQVTSHHLKCGPIIITGGGCWQWRRRGDINSDPGPGVHWGAGANTCNVRGGG